MTEAMPFLRKLILLSYDPRPLAGSFLRLELLGCASGWRPKAARSALQKGTKKSQPPPTNRWGRMEAQVLLHSRRSASR